MPMQNPFLQFETERLMAIHRQWIRADTMRRRFDTLLPEQMPDPSDTAHFETYFISDANTFMYAWYGFLFSVLEATADGVRKHVDTSLDKANSELNLCTFLGLDQRLFADWKKLRNTTFHIRSDYWDTDMFGVMTHGNAGATIRGIHSRIGELLLEAIRQLQSLDDNG